MVFHVLNRANARATLFEKQEDYAAFERVLKEALERVDMRVLAYCLMPNHWHLVLWPRCDGDLSNFMGGLTLTGYGAVSGTGHNEMSRAVGAQRMARAMSASVASTGQPTAVRHRGCRLAAQRQSWRTVW